MEKTIIACISDIHGNWNLFSNKIFKNVELLIIAGDLCKSDNVLDQEEEINNCWNNLINDKIFPKLDTIIIVPGNHDFLLERIYQDKEKLNNLFGRNTKVLVDSMMEYFSNSGNIIKIYGSPRCDLYSFAFPHLKDYSDIYNIPENIDILITHEAPRINELSCISNTKSWYGDKPGNLILGEKVLEIKPRYHIFGHIHYPEKRKINKTTFINASQLLRKKYNPNIKIIKL